MVTVTRGVTKGPDAGPLGFGHTASALTLDRSGSAALALPVDGAASDQPPLSRVPSLQSTWLTGDERSAITGMLLRIAMILFALEALIMCALSGWTLTSAVLWESLLDASLLTLMSTPLIYVTVVKPFALSARNARRALAMELEDKAGQARQLERALDETNSLLCQNEELRQGMQRANERAAAVNEHTLQRIGADLHDGPAQLLAFAMMKFVKLTAPYEATGDERALKELISVRSAVEDTLREIRHISTGLAPPGLERATLRETIELVVGLHEQHTGTAVHVQLDPLPTKTPRAINTCVYRFLQEALSNAYRHAGGKGQALSATTRPANVVRITVSDEGPGFCPLPDDSTGLGLTGMRARIESLGGTLEIQSGRHVDGTRLIAQFDLSKMQPEAVVP
jgi:signal transduction histidine kinase